MFSAYKEEFVYRDFCHIFQSWNWRRGF